MLMCDAQVLLASLPAMKKAAAALAEPHGISPEGAEHVAAVLADALRRARAEA